MTTSFEEPLHRIGHDLVMLDDAVHDHLRQAAEGDDEDDAQHRDRRAAPRAGRSVCRIELSASVKVSWKPLRPVADSVTSAEASASISGLGTGTASTGPASSVR